jgi:two-component system sensor histidine kinase HydH
MIRKMRQFVRPQDVAWLLLFLALAAVSPTRSVTEIVLLTALALLQVLEPRIRVLNTARGNVASILLKLLLGYLLIGFSGGVGSSYYLIMMVPVVSAATTLGALGTFAVTLLACASYLSFLLFVDWTLYMIPPDQVRELCLRVLFLCVLGYLAHRLVEANRAQARKYQSVAEQLAEANRSLRDAEAAVRRSERLAALGQLTAGVAHELRNPLGTMKASAEVLLKNVSKENEIASELAGFIAAEVDRTNTLIARFLDFARPLQLRMKRAELTDVIDRAVAQMQNRQPPFDVSVYKNYSPDIKPFLVDVDLMESVVCNLLINAAEATAPGGAITVKTRLVTGGVEIAVIDRGSGIEAKDMESIFNPFFTTKSNGVGMGLAIVAKIVDEHGGKMAVESESRQGSVFRVLLPVEGEG